MKPATRKQRSAFANGPKVSVADVTDGEQDAYNEDGVLSFLEGDAIKPNSKTTE